MSLKTLVMIGLLSSLAIGCSSLEERTERAAIAHAKYVAKELPATIHKKPKTDESSPFWNGQWQPLEPFKFALRDPRVREVRVNSPTDPGFFALYGSRLKAWRSLNENAGNVRVRGDLRIRSQNGLVRVDLESPQGLVQILMAPSTQTAEEWKARQAYVTNALETQDWESFAQKLATEVAKGANSKDQVVELCKSNKLYPILDHLSISIIEPRFLQMAMSQGEDPTLQYVMEWKSAEQSKAAGGLIDFRGRHGNFVVLVTKPSRETNQRAIVLKRRVKSGNTIVYMTFTLLGPEWISADFEQQ